MSRRPQINTLGQSNLDQRSQKTQSTAHEPAKSGGVFEGLSRFLDAAVGWDRLPPPLGIAVLVGLRKSLRRFNLFDTNVGLPPQPPELPPYDPKFLTERSVDGSYNDLDNPRMGMAGQRFGRNFPVEETHPETEPEIYTPNPRTISRQLLTRTDFIPATSANALVAAWLQFMVRDWFSHGKTKENPFRIPKEPGDTGTKGHRTVMRLAPDPSRADYPSALPPTYINRESAWWDASQIYGVTKEQQEAFRSGTDGKLEIAEDGLPPMSQDPQKRPDKEAGFWLGLAMMQILFMREHNAICVRLKADFPTWSDEDLFQRARLVNSALIAKIHTLDWTPVVIGHPTTQAAMNVQWWGLFGEKMTRSFGRVSDSEIFSGIPGSETDHFKVPYSLTEEFVSVYRMHPLIPDDYVIRGHEDDRLIRNATLKDLSGPGAIEALKNVAQADLYYSFGIAHPGVVTLHNFPKFLQDFERPDGKMMDLGATDIIRDREVGAPRYNKFRRLLGLKPADTFYELAGDVELAREIERVYGGDIEKVDLMVGMFAERRPEGFAFSDTAFRIFMVMASRRLNSDRFLSTDFRPEIYTRTGMEWIMDNNMRSVLVRHHPALGAAMRETSNAFLPWSRSVR